MRVLAWLRRPLAWRPASLLARARIAVGVTGGVTAVLLAALAWEGYETVWTEFDTRGKAITALVARDAESFMTSANLLLAEVADRAGGFAMADPSERQGFEAFLSGMKAMLPGSQAVNIFDETGRIRASTLDVLPPGAQSAGDRSYFQAQRKGDAGLFLSEPITSRANAAPVFVLSRRITDADGRFRGVATVSFRTDYVRDFYRSLLPDEGYTFVWARSDGRILAREPSPSPQDVLAARLPSDFVSRILSSEQGTIGDYLSPFDDTKRYAWYRRLADFPMHVQVSVPREAVIGTWAERTFPYAVLAGLGLVALVHGARRVLRAADAEDRRKKELMDAAARNEVLLNEANHRIKNNMQQAISLLRLNLRRSDNDQVKAVLSDASRQLDCMSKIHEMLYQRAHDGQGIDVGVYLERLCTEVQASEAARGSGVTVQANAVSLRMEASSALNLGLIASEAITNALKYAFPQESAGTIRVSLRRNGVTGTLAIADDGVGLPSISRRDGSLGFNLMEALADGLRGSLSVAGENGTQVVVTFPVEEPALAVAR